MQSLLFLGVFPLAFALNSSACCTALHGASFAGMNATLCNDLMMGGPSYFLVSDVACIGTTYLTCNTTLASYCPNGVGTSFMTLALYSTVVQNKSFGGYRTTFFAASSITGNHSWTVSPNQTGLYFIFANNRLTDIVVETNNITPSGVAGGSDFFKFSPYDCITNFFLSYSPLTLPVGIDGYNFTTLANPRGTSRGKQPANVSALPAGMAEGAFCLRGLFAVNTSSGLAISFEWGFRSAMIAPTAAPSPKENLKGCLSDRTEIRLQGLGNGAGMVGRNTSCGEQLTLVLTENQKSFSWVLVGLLAAALAVNVAVFTTSKLHWHDTEAEYLTVLTATMGVVEYASEVMMIQSLSFDEEFALEFYVCLAALLASSVINVLGNVVILMLYGHFKPWLEAQRLHRVAFAVFAALCFLKGNILAVLASRLDHANTRLFQLPWSRSLQLRFRVLGLFVLCFSSLPQLVVIVLLHERLDEWTPLNALFVAVSICGCTIVAWRAFFELTFKDRGLDKDRNLEDNNKGDLPEPLRMQ